MSSSEFTEEYADDERRIQGAILSEPIAALRLRPAITVSTEATLKAVVELLQDRHIGCALVVDATGRAVGIFTERDLLARVVGKGVDMARARVADYMTRDPETLGPEDKIAWALNKMHLGGYRHVPIVGEGGRPVGVLSVKDIVDFIVELFPATVLNLPPEPGKEARSLDGG